MRVTLRFFARQPEARLALTQRLVAGLTVAEIARTLRSSCPSRSPSASRTPSP
jgi:predicted RNA polymerase sigma factor